MILLTDEQLDVHAPCEDSDDKCNRKDLDCEKCRVICIAKAAQQKMWTELKKPCLKHNWGIGKIYPFFLQHRYLCPKCIEQIEKELKP